MREVCWNSVLSTDFFCKPKTAYIKMSINLKKSIQRRLEPSNSHKVKQSVFKNTDFRARLPEYDS